MELNEKIRHHRVANHMTLEEVANFVGVTKSTVKKWEDGDIAHMGIDKVQKIAQALSVEPSYLMGWEDEETHPAATTHDSPVLGDIPCGKPALATRDGVFPMPGNIHADYTLFCRGDSMEPDIHDGDAVYVKAQPQVENGEMAAVMVDGEATLKKVYMLDDGIILRPINPAYQPMAFFDKAAESVEIIGRIVAIVHLV